MMKKLRAPALLLAASLSGAALAAPSVAASQDDLFWANVQFTEGVPDQASPMPRATRGEQPATPSVARNQDDLFWADVQLTEGVQPDQASPMLRATQSGQPQSNDWFALERRKMEG